MRRLGVVAEITGHGGTGGECQRSVRLAGAGEHVGEQFLSETIGARPEPGLSGSPRMAPKARQALAEMAAGYSTAAVSKVPTTRGGPC